MMGRPRPLRVLVVTHTGEVGGAESALLRVVGAMDPTRFSVECVTMERGPLIERFHGAGVPVHVLGGGELTRVTRGEAATSMRALARNALDSVRVARGLRRLLRRARPDLVVANSLKAAVLVALAAPTAGLPWVWHLHDRLATDYLPTLLSATMRQIARIGPRRVVVNSAATARTLGRGGARRTVLAYPGLEPAAFEAPQTGVNLDGAVGIVGRVSRTKGHREFLGAAEIVGARYLDIDFRIVGAALFEDSDEEQAIREAAAVSAVSSRLHWTGWIDDVAGELRRLRLLVHASPVPEPFGQVVTEAMAAGVPVIATDAGGVPEILDPDGAAVAVADGVRRSDTGLLVRPGDVGALARAIEWALDHPQECSAAAARAREDARCRFGIATTRDAVAAAWAAAARPRG